MPSMSDVCSGSFFPKYGKSSCVNAQILNMGIWKNFDNNLVFMTMSFCLSKLEEATYFSIKVSIWKCINAIWISQLHL